MCGRRYYSPPQTLTTLANFTQGDGYPAAALVRAPTAILTAPPKDLPSGEVCTQQHSPGCGTIYKIIPAGAPIILYRFCSQPNCADGAAPFTGLLQATNGRILRNHPTQWRPLVRREHRGCGTVFEITPGGGSTTLHTFQGADGAGLAHSFKPPTAISMAPPWRAAAILILLAAVPPWVAVPSSK